MNSAHRDDAFRIMDQGRKDTRELSKRITGNPERSRICREAGDKLLDESHQRSRKYAPDENKKIK